MAAWEARAVASTSGCTNPFTGKGAALDGEDASSKSGFGLADFCNRKGNNVNLINWCPSVLSKNINIINLIEVVSLDKI
jgi:hypothetical protein